MKSLKLLLSSLPLLATFLFLASCDLNGQDKKPVVTPFYISLASAEEVQEYLRWSPRRLPLIGAHRGGPMPGYPENCIATFENCLSYAPCLIECDVAKTSDGVLVMFHDDRLERLTTGKGKLEDITWEQLQMLNLKDCEQKVTPYKVPTFADTLAWAKDKAILQIDIKKGLEQQEIVQMIRKYDAERYSLVITYSNEMAKRYHELNPRLMICASAKGVEGTRLLLDSGIPAKNLIAFAGVYEPPKEVYQMLHDKGVRAILGTMGNLDRKASEKGVQVYIDLYNNGADVMATDNVPLVAQAIREMARQKAEAESNKKGEK